LNGWFIQRTLILLLVILKYWKIKKLKSTIINFLNNKINNPNISSKLKIKIKIGPEILNIDEVILFKNGLYVDDMVIIGINDNIQNTIRKIKKLYTISKVEEIDSILSIKIIKTNQCEYTMN